MQNYLFEFKSFLIQYLKSGLYSVWLGICVLLFFFFFPENIYFPRRRNICIKTFSRSILLAKVHVNFSGRFYLIGSELILFLPGFSMPWKFLASEY